MGKRIFAADALKPTDMITHKGFERVFERKNEADFPNYFDSVTGSP
jgi:hypothetical protein